MDIFKNKKKIIGRQIKTLGNIIAPIASGISVLNPVFIGIPIIASVANELFTFFDSQSTEKRLKNLETAILQNNIDINDFAEGVANLDEHAQYVVRNVVKHMCIASQPEVVDTINQAIIDVVMSKNYELPEHACEILQQFNANDIKLLQLIKSFQIKGEKKEFVKRNKEIQEAKNTFGWQDRFFCFENTVTIFWSDFIEFINYKGNYKEMGLFLNQTFIKITGDDIVDNSNIELAYIARSIIKMQGLGVLQCDFLPTIGTSSVNNIDRFHITFFGQKILEYIDIAEEPEK